MAKKDAMYGMAMFFAIVVLGGLAVLYAGNALGILPSGGGSVVVNPGSGSGAPPVIQMTQLCGSTGMGTINFREKNDLNLTGTEWGTDVLYVYLKNTDGSIGNLIGTATSAGTSSYATLGATTANVACGQKLVGYVLSSSTATAQITSVDQSNGVALNADGGVDIDMNNQNIYITAHKTGVPSALQFRMFDVDNNNYMYNATGSTTDWQGSGAEFGAVTDATNLTATNNGQYTLNLYTRAIRTNGQFNADRDGTIIGVQAAIGTWQNVVITGPGVSPISSSQLNAQESKYFSNYQYFFKTTAPLANTPNSVFNVVLKAQPSVSSWKCPTITFAAKGNYLGTTTGYMTLHSAAKDDSSYTAVYTVQNVRVLFGAGSSACVRGT